MSHHPEPEAEDSLLTPTTSAPVPALGGAGTPHALRLQEEIARRVSPQVLCSKLLELMDFEKISHDRNGEARAVPDGGVQLRATELILSLLTARPPEAPPPPESPATTLETLRARISQSPVFAQTLRSLVETV